MRGESGIAGEASINVLFLVLVHHAINEYQLRLDVQCFSGLCINLFILCRSFNTLHAEIIHTSPFINTEIKFINLRSK